MSLLILNWGPTSIVKTLPFPLHVLSTPLNWTDLSLKGSITLTTTDRSHLTQIWSLDHPPSPFKNSPRFYHHLLLNTFSDSSFSRLSSSTNYSDHIQKKCRIRLRNRFFKWIQNQEITASFTHDHLKLNWNIHHQR